MREHEREKETELQGGRYYRLHIDYGYKLYEMQNKWQRYRETEIQRYRA